MVDVQVMIQVGLLCQSGRCLDNSHLNLTLVVARCTDAGNLSKRETPL